MLSASIIQTFLTVGITLLSATVILVLLLRFVERVHQKKKEDDYGDY